jgi:hypothetical protein
MGCKQMEEESTGTDVKKARQSAELFLVWRRRPHVTLGFARRAERISTRLLAWADCSRQSTVINAIIVVPQRLTQIDAATEYLDFFLRTRRSIGRKETIVHYRIKVLVVPILEDGLKNVLAQTAHSVKPLIGKQIECFARKNLFDFSYGKLFVDLR